MAIGRDPRMGVFEMARNAPIALLLMSLTGCQLGDSPAVRAASRPGSALRVATLNVAHGRGDTPARKVVSRSRAQANLVEAAALLERERIDVAAVQEVDAPSLWSGRFDHVALLSTSGGYPHHFHGLHVTSGDSAGQFQYGTAILSKTGLLDPESLVFAASPFGKSNWIGRKGLVVAEVEFMGRSIVIVSLHLDTFKRGTRLDNAEELIRFVRRRAAPLIVMGDFNCAWSEDSALKRIVEGLSLRAHQPDSVETFQTYPAKKPKKRIDWILISPELRFIDYRTCGDVVSDHRAVIADVTWRDGSR